MQVDLSMPKDTLATHSDLSADHGFMLKLSCLSLCCMQRHERIAKAIALSGKQKQAIAKECGVSGASVSQWISGDSKSMKPENLYKLAAATGFCPEWLAIGVGPERPDSYITSSITSQSAKPVDEPNVSFSAPLNVGALSFRKYPLISWVAAGAWQESCDNFHPGDADEWIESPENAGPHGYWLTVKGPSMQPDFPEGSRILVRPEGFDLSSGKLCIARLKDSGETTFKQYLRDGGAAYLQPLNPAFPIMPVTENVEIIGIVIDGKMRPSLFR